MKYRIISVSKNNKILYYKVQKKGFFFGWNTMKECVGYMSDLTVTITFVTIEEAREFIRQLQIIDLPSIETIVEEL